MAEVILGRAGSTVTVDLDVCAKSGRRTEHRCTYRGSTTPGWVTVLLFITLVGFLLAGAMTSRSYTVTLPLAKDVYDRSRRNRRIAWCCGLVGLGVLVVAIATDALSDGGWAPIGFGLVVVALVGSYVSALVTNVGFRTTRYDELVVTRAHPAFVRAVAAASTEEVRGVR